MFDTLLQAIAPHYCYGCGKVGSVLCLYCKYNITSENLERCLLCLHASLRGVCGACRSKSPYKNGWCAGVREGALEKIIDDYKFRRTKAAYRTLAQLLHETLPILPSGTIVVAIPTIDQHVRQRGYDHCLLIAKKFAQLRGISCSPRLLQRRYSSSQRGKSEQERRAQAEIAFYIEERFVEEDRPYLIIDDIMTTGATMQAAGRLLKKAGIREVFMAVVARQILDE